jgi:mannosyltransferase OCH1-like enzyme
MISDILIFFIIILLFYLFNKYLHHLNNLHNLEKFTVTIGIPKIIHQTAPRDKSRWNEDWITCQESWKKYFPEPEYKHIMWYDEDLDNLILNDYEWFYDIYKSYKKNIQRIDIARYFILYKYGGIYADMDYMCMKNFYDLLPSDKVSISESPHKENEYIQNALMASNINNDFWIKVIDEATIRKNSKRVLFSTGPKLVSDVYEKNKDSVNVLPCNLFNPLPDSEEFNSKDTFTKHLGTKSWL